MKQNKYRPIYVSYIIEYTVHAIKILTRQILAFRGSSEQLYEYNDGNFLKLLQTFPKFYAVIQRSELKNMPHYSDHQM